MEGLPVRYGFQWEMESLGLAKEEKWWEARNGGHEMDVDGVSLGSCWVVYKFQCPGFFCFGQVCKYTLGGGS